jgi:DNA-binding SARP family transcriptional activator
VRVAISAASGLGNEIEGLARWSLHLFGGFELSVLPGNERVALPRKRQRVLVAYLALSPTCRTSRRKLATLLWGDTTDETALENLRTELWSVRKALGDAQHRVIASKGEDIVLDATAFAVDVLMFRGLAAQSDRAELEAAAKLYSGELLDGLGIENEEFESWRRTQATRCRDQAIEVLNRLMTQLAELGETERAIEAGLRILEFDPLREGAGRRLMRLYGGGGRRSAAVSSIVRLAMR